MCLKHLFIHFKLSTLFFKKFVWKHSRAIIITCWWAVPSPSRMSPTNISPPPTHYIIRFHAYPHHYTWSRPPYTLNIRPSLSSRCYPDKPLNKLLPRSATVLDAHTTTTRPVYAYLHEYIHTSLSQTLEHIK